MAPPCELIHQGTAIWPIIVDSSIRQSLDKRLTNDAPPLFRLLLKDIHACAIPSMEVSFAMPALLTRQRPECRTARRVDDRGIDERATTEKRCAARLAIR